MQWLKFIAVKLTLCIIFGILLGYFSNPSPIVSLSLTLFFLLILGIVFIRKHHSSSLLFGTITTLLAISIGALSFSFSQPKNWPDHYSHFPQHEKREWTLKIREVLKPTLYSHRYIAEVQQADSLKASGKIFLNINRDSTGNALLVDDEIIAYSALTPLSSPLNPLQFNYKKYAEGLGIYHRLKISAVQFAKKDTPSKTLMGIAARARNHLIGKLREHPFGREELGVIQALLLGERNDLSQETNTHYKDAGAFHILALSGLHIGILLGLLHFLLKPLELLPKGKTIKLFIIVLCLWNFAFLAGLSASIIRAVTMFSFVAYALYLNRPTSNFNVLALSLLFILLLINPMLLFQVGFQLSYAAVFSIVLIFPKLQEFWTPKNWFLKKGWELLSVSIAAQLGVLPISLFYFHQFPGLFFVSNLIVVPFLAFILGMGILLLILVVFDILPSFLALGYNSIIKSMNWVIGQIAQQELFLFKNIYFDAVQLVLSFVIIISMGLLFAKASFKRVLMCFLGILCFQLWWYYVSLELYKTETILIAHIPRSSAILYQSGNSLSVFHRDSLATARVVNDFSLSKNIGKINYSILQNSFRYGEDNLFVVDSSGFYPKTDYKVTTLLLTQSPKINLDRLIDTLHPEIIVADGSNYKSYIAQWEASCKKRKLPFHYTGEKGALIYTFE
ncbi:competence protein ComEC [Arenibacter nanhaiticus]|uniref:Competence protein ComEC n=1 Tax=Arenibacter nanhaiticus TaxID=558155 RepID=A0A1M6F6T4_9FLAO|nr:ComEC/Rec2 family competence protein [Arenibacter nanhaiticus]SHI93372.1 competence protein ComEC [Arenibacter nanhaiticus]